MAPNPPRPGVHSLAPGMSADRRSDEFLTPIRLSTEELAEQDLGLLQEYLPPEPVELPLDEQEHHLRPAICLEDPPEEFLVVIEKETPTTSLGVGFDPVDGMSLLVMAIGEGPVKDWNRLKRPLHCDVRLFDRVVSVNGIVGDSKDLLKEVVHDRVVELLVRRPVQWIMVVEKAALTDDTQDNLGLLADDAGNALLVTDFVSGIFQDWNWRNWQCPLRKNDRILEVNGRRGTASQLLALIKKEPVLKMLIEH